ncbi:protein Wnt-8b-like [Tubulanus polymorphus]|uniref:protein Wnt-8b-like n=1 Tax=Tubulanus polymorphus TaxID=672921 RepID=UPI003DA1EEDA
MAVVFWVVLGVAVLISTFGGVTNWQYNVLITGSKVCLPFEGCLAFSGSVAAGVLTGINECKYQFKWEKWNCSVSAFDIFKDQNLSPSSRETSFIYAISSAGVMFTLTRNCSLGEIDKCGCDDTRKKGKRGHKDWKWDGCSDNVQFGERIAKLVIDSTENGKDTRAMVNLHNNNAGRQAVIKKMKLTCKCHGVSGSCTTKTCIRQLSDFRTVGDYLKRKYRRAKRIDLQGGELNQGNLARHIAHSGVKDTDMLYLEDSPDYCMANNTAGTYGTLGRECVRPSKKKGKRNLTTAEKRSCKVLCRDCGLTVKKSVVPVESKCNCKFHWCCEVTCKTCRMKATKYICTVKSNGKTKKPKKSSKSKKKNAKKAAGKT